MKTIIKLNHDDVVTVKNGLLTIENNSELKMFVGDRDADESVFSDNTENATERIVMLLKRYLLDLQKSKYLVLKNFTLLRIQHRKLLK